ncbi:MAG: DivIVA domain-containing protein [Bdellovibrionales bacterium]|nr:DivIVA domain-containing protein [Bdellovibrionales bacterium]
MQDKESLSTQLTPIQIRTKEFNKLRRDYTPKVVAVFLESLSAQWEAKNNEERKLLNKIKLLEEDLKEWKDREDKIIQLREGAKIKAQEIEAQASRDASLFLKSVQDRAEQIRRKTEEWLERVIAEVDKTETRKRQLVEALKATLDEHYAILSDEQSLPALGLDLSSVSGTAKGTN